MARPRGELGHYCWWTKAYAKPPGDAIIRIFFEAYQIGKCTICRGFVCPTVGFEEVKTPTLTSGTRVRFRIGLFLRR